jgi:predicted dehydrogenase
MNQIKHYYTILALIFLATSCGGDRQTKGTAGSEETNDTQNTETMFEPVTGKVSVMNLDPGHFHAALVHKTMYEGVDPEIHVFAPEGPEVQDFLNRIRDYNSRSEDPTSWDPKVYSGEDFLEKMLEEKPGNVMVVSGNNARKAEYILEAVEAGIHVLADKPMVITPEEFPILEKAFNVAGEKGVLLYDIMTERYEITTILQKEFAQVAEVFGQLLEGSPEEPAITKESVHHFFKYVSGKPLVRPPWFFDVDQQGEGIVDVTTHLVDLIQWEAFPGVTLEKKDVNILSAKRWTTELSPEMFRKVTGLERYPDYLQKDLEGELLKVYSNGEINYTLKGVHAKASVIWNFQAPEGTGDTHYSVMRGTRSALVIRQGEAEGFRPELYIEMNPGEDREQFRKELENAFSSGPGQKYPGITPKEAGDSSWRVEIPDSYRKGHEAHFSQVMEKFLEYVSAGRLPAWEIPNMIVKYYTTTEGMRKAME